MTERKVALCYVRLSFTKDASDLTSPERQRANITEACRRNGWIPEWYEDAKGHKSATKEENRPAWKALKTRLKDKDVIALVVNEQSRAMRNAWRAIKLFEELPAYGVVLHLASLNRTIDITTPDGRMSAYIQAFLDDLYALDASRRSSDSIRYRKGKGISVGIPPFGTVRDENGHLVKSEEGVWVMPDGTHQVAKNNLKVPHPEALWRGFAECAERILTLYKDNLHGYSWIANRVNSEGWLFRDRWGNPRNLNGDDVRRVTYNWREYAGMINQGRAKERIAHRHASALIETGRAVFDVELLRAVAQTQHERSVTKRPVGSPKQAHVFALSFLSYCACCDRNAKEKENANLRTRLTGHNKKGELRYRHGDSNRCETKRKSVLLEELENDFVQLIEALSVHPDATEFLAEVAVQTRFGGAENQTELDEQKKVAIAKHRRALKNNLTLFQSGEIDGEEYYRQKDYHERQVGYWEAQTTEKQQIVLELTACAELLKRLKMFWELSTGDDRRLLAHSLFDEVVYDLDRKRIVDFKVKGWAEPFLVLRAMAYTDAVSEETKNRLNDGFKFGLLLDPNGVQGQDTVRDIQVRDAKEIVLKVVYFERDRVFTLSIAERDKRIRERYADGETLSDLAREYDISPQRVFQVLREG